MRIGSKILLPYLALFLLTGTAGGVMIVRYGAEQSAVSRSILQVERANARVSDLSSLSGNIRGELLAYEFTGNVAHLDAIDAIDNQIEAILQELNSLIVTPQGQELFARFQESRSASRQLRTALMDALRRNADEAQSFFEQWSLRAAQTQSILLELTDYKQQLLEQAVAHTNETSEKTRRMLLGLLALALALMFFVATYHSTSIIRPLKQLRSHAERIARGDLDPEITWRIPEDEIGDLTHSIRGMTAKLRQSNEALEQRVRERTQELMIAKEQIEQEASNVRKFQQAVESAFDAVFMTSEGPGIVYVNPAWERLTGFANDELLGRDPWSLLSARTDPRVRSELEAAMQRGEPFYTEDIVARRKNGTEFEMELTVYPIQDTDGTTFLVGVAHDITRRRRLDRAKTDFVSLASHQLRTPLTGIRWALGRLHKAQEILSEPHRQMLSAARSATARMAETIDTMLMISRIEAEKIDLKPWDLRLGIFLRNIVHENKHLYEAKRQKVELACAEDVHLRTDPNVLHEIVTNLLTNAIKYTPANGSIRIRASRQDDNVRLEIQDTGYGIPSDQQHKVFSKFFRGDNIVQNDPDGTGLGLYLVYALVRLIEGSISFVSEENRGTTFTILLPLSLPTHGQNGVSR